MTIPGFDITQDLINKWVLQNRPKRIIDIRSEIILEDKRISCNAATLYMMESKHNIVMHVVSNSYYSYDKILIYFDYRILNWRNSVYNLKDFYQASFQIVKSIGYL